MPTQQECVSKYGEKYMGKLKKKERAKLGAREVAEGFIAWLREKKEIELVVAEAYLGYLGFALFDCCKDERETIEVLEEVRVPQRDYGNHKH